MSKMLRCVLLAKMSLGRNVMLLLYRYEGCSCVCAMVACDCCMEFLEKCVAGEDVVREGCEAVVLHDLSKDEKTQVRERRRREERERVLS